MIISGLILLSTLLVAWFVNRDISRSLGSLATAMEKLAGNDIANAIPGVDRGDEVGGMARTVLVFRDHMAREVELTAQQVEQRRLSEQEKHAALVGMADKIESESDEALRHVASRTAAIADSAAEMTASASRTGAASAGAASAAAQALANAQTVASAAEQLSVSIHEIGSQVGQSSTVVSRAVQAGNETRATIEALNEKVGRIGVVADMIGEIAAKTNLLALNATIEAARAGDAGKGFAVVASEVKQLATQTAKSTEEIGRHIAEVKAATGESVASVTRIEATITEINAIAGSIAAAVEEQGAATAEIARNVTETANAANEMTRRTQQVSTEAERTGEQAAAVLDNINGLQTAVVDLKHSVVRVVRTSTADVDRRENERYQMDARGRITVSGVGTHDVRVVDISEGGAGIQGGPALPPRATGTLALDGVGQTLAFTVKDSDEHGLVHLAFDQPAGEALRTLLQRVAPRQAA
jgi:methyl-accepting chemotaxis protein